jgi:hypothetical protein
VEIDFDSDDNGEVMAPVRQKQRLVVAAKRSTLLQDLERPTSRWCYRQSVSQTLTYIRLLPMRATPSSGNLALPNPAVAFRIERNRRPFQRKVDRLEQNSNLMRRTGGCGVGGEDYPLRNAHPNADKAINMTSTAPNIHSIPQPSTRSRPKTSPKFTHRRNNLIMVS